MKAIFKLFALCFLLVACTSPPIATPPLLAPSALGRTVHASQLLAIEYDGQSWTMQGALEANPQTVRLVGLTPLGQRVISLRWDGSQLNEERDARLPAQVSGAQILSDLQLIYWPKAALTAALPATWGVDEQAGQRTFLLDAAPWIRIRCDNADALQGQCVFEHLRYGYRLIIDSRLDAP